MNQTIRSRIEQIKRGEIPEGYEKTPFGIFPCDWEKDKSFKELFSFFGGLGKSREELGTNGVCYLHYGDMHTGNFTKVSYAQYLDKPKYEIKINGEESFLMNDGDIAFLDASEDLEGTSRAVLIDNPENRPFIAGLHTILAKEKQKVLSKNYKQYISMPQYVRKQFQRLAVGFKVYGLNRETFNKVKISFPKSKSEQEKIAEILQEQDRLIELKEKLIEEKKKQKKYLMLLLLTGEKRLSDFSGEWNKVHLRELCSIRTGKLDANAAVENARYPFFTCSKDELRIDTYSFDGEAILLAGNGEVGHTKYYSGKFDAYQRTYVLMDFKINPKLLKCYIDMVMPSIVQKELQGGAMPYIKLSTLEKVSFFAPNDFSEQEAIIKYIELFAVEIELLQKELDEQKRKKQALMQLLLTGIVKVKA